MRWLALIALIGGGCFGSTPQPVNYSLEPPATRPLESRPQPTTLLVHRFDAALAVDRVELVYRPKGHELRYYALHRWVARPGRMVGEAIVRHLDEAHLFSTVTSRQTEGRADFELRGVVLAMEELSDGPWQARLAIRMTMSEIDTGKVVWEHGCDVVRAVAHERPDAVVATLVALFGDELERMTQSLRAALPRIAASYRADQTGPDDGSL
jgi:ABC-type uncharacterized transport system auxiliary subunit